MNQYLDKIADSLLSLIPLLKKKLLHSHTNFPQKDMSPSHIHILFILKDMGTMPVSEIGKKLCISKSNMTPLIDKLVSEAMVSRLPDAHDRRIINIEITDKGIAFLNKLTNQVSTGIKSKLSPLPEDDLTELSSSLNKIKTILSKLE